MGLGCRAEGTSGSLGGSGGGETVRVICEGSLADATFALKLKRIARTLKHLLLPKETSTYTTREQFKISKVEPWNSVRVTLSVPREAAARLSRLASSRDPQLRELGILAVQIASDQIYTLTNNNNTEENSVNGPSVTGGAQGAQSGVSPTGLSGVPGIPQHATNGPANSESPPGLSTSTSASQDVFLKPHPVSGPLGGSSGFRSPNAVVPPNSAPSPFMTTGSKPNHLSAVGLPGGKTTKGGKGRVGTGNGVSLSGMSPTDYEDMQARIADSIESVVQRQRELFQEEQEREKEIKDRLKGIESATPPLDGTMNEVTEEDFETLQELLLSQSDLDLSEAALSALDTPPPSDPDNSRKMMQMTQGPKGPLSIDRNASLINMLERKQSPVSNDHRFIMGGGQMLQQNQSPYQQIQTMQQPPQPQQQLQMQQQQLQQQQQPSQMYRSPHPQQQQQFGGNQSGIQVQQQQPQLLQQQQFRQMSPQQRMMSPMQAQHINPQQRIQIMQQQQVNMQMQQQHTMVNPRPQHQQQRLPMQQPQGGQNMQQMHLQRLLQIQQQPQQMQMQQQMQQQQQQSQLQQQNQMQQQQQQSQLQQQQNQPQMQQVQPHSVQFVGGGPQQQQQQQQKMMQQQQQPQMQFQQVRGMMPQQNQQGQMQQQQQLMQQQMNHQPHLQPIQQPQQQMVYRHQMIQQQQPMQQVQQTMQLQHQGMSNGPYQQPQTNVQQMTRQIPVSPGPGVHQMNQMANHPQTIQRQHHGMHGGPSPSHSPVAVSPQVRSASASPSPATTPDPRASPQSYNCIGSGPLMGGSSPLHHHNQNNGRNSAGPTPPSAQHSPNTDSQDRMTPQGNMNMGMQQQSPANCIVVSQSNAMQNQQAQRFQQANGGSPSKFTLILNPDESVVNMGGMVGNVGGQTASKTIKVVTLPKGAPANLFSTVKLQVKTVDSVEGGAAGGGGMKRKIEDVPSHQQPPAKVVKQ